MMRASASLPPITRRAKIAIWLMIGSGLLLFVLANTHLVYVAVKSQPACVAASPQGISDIAKRRFGAAEWACSPDGDSSRKPAGRGP
jgi:hypothetical protein